MSTVRVGPVATMTERALVRAHADRLMGLGRRQSVGRQGVVALMSYRAERMYAPQAAAGRARDRLVLP